MNSKDPKLQVEFTQNNNLKLNLRPLRSKDEQALAKLLLSLSEDTKRFFTYPSFDQAMAASLCQDIDKYDKIRFVLENSKNSELIGIFEFSMDLVEEDITRFRNHGVNLEVARTSRYGPVLAEAYQGKGIALVVFKKIIPLISYLGKDTIILFGGVHKDNAKAIKHYLSLGFQEVCEFVNSDGIACLDMIYKINP
ncbi:MAG: GNAT family protein [Candidatus Dojkabacteria bacterium]|uniref:N-acetyltransferase domain-containing protein n=2 Tax=Candidatus Dojkabacteria TaxID=74243 RepID=A0A136KKV4_9BACT|nr:MAG: hypothetical protein UZ20_WS6002000222 [candidate division WS6 bacterium OLB21]MBW7954063.1 GNAT family N-acetyltransferase [Candidatus Dojkabacteria bacterium]WKZ28016.1 MAG: GNAT family protein [Candidatus Dojkabacteria bacterium]